MDAVKRYWPDESAGGEPCMVEDSTYGQWVAYWDYKVLADKLEDARVSASLVRENLNSQLTDWRERALRCEKLRRDIVPVKP